MTKHKFHNQIKAWADGWKIERRHPILTSDRWVLAANPPQWLESCEYRIIPDAEGFLPWYGGEEGECPVDPHVMIEWKMLTQDTTLHVCTAKEFIWGEGGGRLPIYYRIKQQPEKKKERIFSGDASEDMWAEINALNELSTGKQIGEVLYGICCRLQKLESQFADHLTIPKNPP